MAVVFFSLLAPACLAQNLTLTFDDLADNPTNGIAVSDGYNGFNWDNFYEIDGVNYANNPSGYEAGVISANNVAYNGAGNSASITCTNQFNLLSAYLTAAWNDGLKVKVKGYLDGTLAYDNTYTLSATNSTLVNFDYLDVDEVDFTASGGTQDSNYAASGTEFVMDNVSVEILTTGSLKVTITPAGAVAAGATWSVDGTNWYTSGSVLTGLSPGNLTLEFTNVDGWSTPASQIVTISDGQQTTATGKYGVPNSLLVTLSPASVVAAGAVWSVDGLNWHTNGFVLTNLSGNLTLEFSDVNGWITPSNQIVTITNGEQTIAAGNYILRGSLQVTITPASAAAAGATWSVDGANWLSSGETLDDLAPGRYSIQFSAATNYDTPSVQSITISAGNLTTATGTYKPATGAAQAAIDPAAAVAAGAQWRVDNGAWQKSGVTVSNLSVGSHTITYKPIAGWLAAGTNTFSCSAHQTQSFIGTYEPAGSLTVMLKPAAAAAATGARWQVNSGAWQTSGATVTNLLTGNYTVNFSALTGWTTPASLPVTIAQNVKTSTNVTYWALTNRLQVQLAGLGKLSPNDSNAWLQAGLNYSITSAPAAGFKFTSWTVSTNWLGGTVTNSAILHFVMAANLTLLATFTETSNPTLAITAPAAGQKMTNTLATVKGTASDKWAVAGVWYQVNGAAWSAAASSNHWTNWNGTAALIAGTNIIRAYATNLGGHYSATNSVSVVSSNSFKFRLSSEAVQPLQPGGLTFTLHLSDNVNGRIEYSTDLIHWENWTNFTSTTDAITFRDPAVTNSTKRFYRAVIP